MTQFDPNRDPRLQKYTTHGGGTVQAVLTHESVGPDYIAIWIGAKIIQVSSGSYPNEGMTALFAGMLSALRVAYPHYVPRAAGDAAPAPAGPAAEEPLVVWTESHQLQAAEDGWGIFVLGAGRSIEIQRLDEANCFPDDGAARLHVLDRAMNGWEFHQLALSYIRQERRRLKSGARAS